MTESQILIGSFISTCQVLIWLITESAREYSSRMTSKIATWELFYLLCSLPLCEVIPGHYSTWCTLWSCNIYNSWNINTWTIMDWARSNVSFLVFIHESHQIQSVFVFIKCNVSLGVHKVQKKKEKKCMSFYLFQLSFHLVSIWTITEHVWSIVKQI